MLLCSFHQNRVVAINFDHVQKLIPFCKYFNEQLTKILMILCSFRQNTGSLKGVQRHLARLLNTTVEGMSIDFDDFVGNAVRAVELMINIC